MRTSVFGTAALAVKNVLLAALGDGQEVAAVCAEDEGSDGSHCCVCGFDGCGSMSSG